MFKDIFLFELRYRARRPATYFYFLIFFLMVFFATVSDNVTIGERAGNLLRNSPSAIFRITAIMNAFGIMVISAIMSTPVYRDFDHNVHPLLYSYPMKKGAYLAGRFLGSYVYAILVFVSIPLAIYLGSIIAPAAGWIEASRFDSFRLMAYLSPYMMLVIPNTFFLGAVFFSLVSMKKRMVYSYLGSILFLVLYLWAASHYIKLDSKEMASLLDPFGMATFYITTQYWTPAEINTQLIPLSGAFLLNRVIWVSLGALILAFAFWRFKLVTVTENGGRKRSVKPVGEDVDDVKVNVDLPKVKIIHSSVNHIKQMLSLGWIDFSTVVKDLPFIGMVAAGLFLLFGNAVSVTGVYDGSNYPVTYILLDYLSGNFMLIMLIIITFYSGELVWRERGFKIDQIMDSLPLPNWLYTGSKLWAMLLILLLMSVILMISCLSIQIYHGFFDLNIPLYLSNIFSGQLSVYFAFAVLAIFIQTLASNKFTGHVIVLFYYIIISFGFDFIGLQHKLWQFPLTPPSPYSDMNGFGNFLVGVRWYQLAWLFMMVIIFVITTLFWKRGFNPSLRNRIRVAVAQFKGGTRAVFMFAVAGFIAVGGYIVYNTTILNRFVTTKQGEKNLVSYEKTYKKYEGIPQPKVKAANLNVEIYPDRRNLVINGTFKLKNETHDPIDSVHVLLSEKVQLESCRIGDTSEIVLADTQQGYYMVKLSERLIPGQSVDMLFSLKVVNRGFTDDRGMVTIVENGTFFNNMGFIPVIGYQSETELEEVNKRKKYGLPPKGRMAPRTDSVALQSTYLGAIGDWIDFEATVSTKEGQIAIAPGRLVRDWVENGRHYFHYKMDRPILNFYAFLSADYEVLADRWNDVDLKVYYHKGHEYNIDKMMEAMKASLDYFTKNYSPFQHSELRIVEFPRYDSFAQSFSTTIPYSESIGFIANLEDEEDIDYVYYVTAHEIAHQWWAHQVIGGNVQGATLMSEALAQYSALMVMEKRYGKYQMRKFLKHELDKYLQGRRTEMEKELPLILCENQNYIHYNKGSVVMYALQDYIGEENVNAALAAYLEDWAYKEPPFSTSEHFMEYIYGHTPDSLRYLVHDMFEAITVYDIKAKEAEMEQLEDGRYRVTLTGDVQKFYADSLGNETLAPLNDWIDVGVMTTRKVDGKKKNVALYMQKHRISNSNPTFEIIVDEKPETAGIDPYNKLVDRHSDNNTVKIKG